MRIKLYSLDLEKNQNKMKVSNMLSGAVTIKDTNTIMCTFRTLGLKILQSFIIFILARGGSDKK